MRTGEKEPADGDLVKSNADTFHAVTFDAVTVDAAELRVGDAIECSVTECNGTAFTVTEFGVIECNPSVKVENVGSRNRIAAVAATNERSFSVIGRRKVAVHRVKQSQICPDRAREFVRERSQSLPQPANVSRGAKSPEVQIIQRRHQFEAML